MQELEQQQARSQYICRRASPAACVSGPAGLALSPSACMSDLQPSRCGCPAATSTNPMSGRFSPCFGFDCPCSGGQAAGGHSDHLRAHDAPAQRPSGDGPGPRAIRSGGFLCFRYAAPARAVPPCRRPCACAVRACEGLAGGPHPPIRAPSVAFKPAGRRKAVAALQAAVFQAPDICVGRAMQAAVCSATILSRCSLSSASEQHRMPQAKRTSPR